MDLLEARATGVENRHPWESARANFVTGVVGAVVATQVGQKVILDCGSGDCFVATHIVDRLPGVEVRCFDPNYSLDEIQRYSALRPGRVSVSQQLPVGSHDLVLFLDVLEHVDDDVELLRRTVEGSMRSGGHVLITVPAMQSLFSDHDRFLGHYRRYSSSALASLATKAGLTIERSGGLFASLIVPRALSLASEIAGQKIRSLIGGGGGPSPNVGLGHWRASPLVTRTIDSFMTRELRVETSLASAGLPVPGLSRWLLGRKA